MEVRKLDAPFGVAVSGVDLNVSGTEPEVIDALVDLLHANRFLLIKNQKFDIRPFADFGRQWGDPIVHVVRGIRSEECPEVARVGNVGERQREDKLRYAAAFWHTDQAYEADPASATMLYCVMAPAMGGETMLADTVAAYDALSDEMKARIEGLIALHSYGAASGRDGEYDARAALTDEQRRNVVAVRHPIALRHPFTGVKSLYAVAGTPFGIEGMADDEAQDLLAELKRHVLKPEFRYDHKYELGDVAIWDTFATLHSAVPMPYADEDSPNARLLWRVSCRGVPVTIKRRRALSAAR
jgi:taurine dioxygenase